MGESGPTSGTGPPGSSDRPAVTTTVVIVGGLAITIACWLLLWSVLRGRDGDNIAERVVFYGLIAVGLACAVVIRRLRRGGPLPRKAAAAIRYAMIAGLLPFMVVCVIGLRSSLREVLDLMYVPADHPERGLASALLDVVIFGAGIILGPYAAWRIWRRHRGRSDGANRPAGSSAASQFRGPAEG